MGDLEEDFPLERRKKCLLNSEKVWASVSSLTSWLCNVFAKDVKKVLPFLVIKNEKP